MMVRISPLLALFMWTSIPAVAQETATLAQCAQVQPVVQRLLADAAARLEVARQDNSATALRSAVDDLDAALRDVRAQLAPCANVQPANAHPGHTMPSVQQAPAAVVPGAKPPAGAIDPHAGHVMPAAPANPTPRVKPAPGANPPASAKPPAAPPPIDHSKMSMEAPPETATQATDPVCGLKVDPASAPQTKHGGQTYYFCSEQHRELFQKTPAKYSPKGQ